MTNSKDPGLGSKFRKKVDRLINQDGSYNIIRVGGLKGFRDAYKLLVDLSWGKFFLVIFAGYILINLLFASLYVLVGTDQLSTINHHDQPFWEAFFFSVQTFTSVGYGQLSPTGWGADIIAAFESFTGLISIALITGLLYGRFSKPSAKILFSDNIIITPFQEKTALMFKIVNQRNNFLLNAKVNTMLILDKGNGDEAFNKQYHRLELQIDEVQFFPLTWTVVHLIDEDSPLYNLSLEEIKKRSGEVIILVEAFDETHSSRVVQKHSYGGEQWLENVKFERNFKTNDEGKIVLYVDQLNNMQSNLPNK